MTDLGMPSGRHDPGPVDWKCFQCGKVIDFSEHYVSVTVVRDFGHGRTGGGRKQFHPECLVAFRRTPVKTGVTYRVSDDAEEENTP